MVGSLVSWMVVGLLAPPASGAVNITWDADLAFERDRDAYESRLRSMVNDAHDTQARAFALALPRGISVIVYAPAAYEKRFGRAMAQKAAAHYQRSAIHVNGGQRLDGRFASTMHHEMVHAFVDYKHTARFVPTWLNEGLAEAAEKFSLGFHDLAPSQWQELRLLAQGGQVPKLTDRGHLTHQGYLLSWAATLYLDSKSPGAARRVVLAMINDGKSLEAALNYEAALDLVTLEKTFAVWLRDHR